MNFERMLPLVFVGLWSTGFIAARLVAPYADPLTFLSYRYVLSAAAFMVIAISQGAPWPQGARAWANALLAGVLLQGVYLGGVFWSVRHGLPAGIAALIVGLQPLLTALLAFPLLGETVGSRKWVGIVLGFAGALMVLGPQLQMGTLAVSAGPLVASVAAMLGITLGTIWQKHIGAAADIRTGAATQFIGAAAITIPIALSTEAGRFEMVWQSWVGLLWSVFGLSVGAISLLLFMIRRGSVASVASLFYLVPPVVAVFAYLLFDETLDALQITGMVVAALGVATATAGSRA
ncbi:DMT family transporter [Salinisphaera sp. T31B1]|uniref:DMT family transporter n=1 Tax=Salinisphaera sp. T31B1 TaxID=727963 RepID=UPI00333EE3F1